MLAGKKRLLKLSDIKTITLPKAKYIDELQKSALFTHVQKDVNLNMYIPDESSCGSLSRDFLLNADT